MSVEFATPSDSRERHAISNGIESGIQRLDRPTASRTRGQSVYQLRQTAAGWSGPLRAARPDVY